MAAPRIVLLATAAAALAACTMPYGPRDPYPPCDRYDPYAGADPYGYPPPPRGPYPPDDDRYGAPAVDPYRAVGTEPFWSLTLTPEGMRFENADGMRVAEPTPRLQRGVAGDLYRGRRLEVNIVHRECSDGMSDRVYPNEVQVWVDGRGYRGCGAPERFFQSGWEQQRYDTERDAPAVPLARTNWQVTRVNGVAVPARDHYLNFLPDASLVAKFGCNEMRGRYRLVGDRLDLGDGLAMTRMGCADMTMETRATNILSRPVRVALERDRLTLSNERGRIDAVRAR